MDVYGTICIVIMYGEDGTWIASEWSPGLSLFSCDICSHRPMRTKTVAWKMNYFGQSKLLKDVQHITEVKVASLITTKLLLYNDAIQNSSGVAEVSHMFRQKKSSFSHFIYVHLSLYRAKQTSFQRPIPKAWVEMIVFLSYLSLESRSFHRFITLFRFRVVMGKTVWLLIVNKSL